MIMHIELSGIGNFPSVCIIDGKKNAVQLKVSKANKKV